MENDLLGALKAILGEGYSGEEAVKFLVRKGVITTARQRMFVVGFTWRHLMSTGDRKALDIEQELAVNFDISRQRVQQIRNSFNKMDVQKRTGRRQKL
jgi:hypothetical protein